MTLSRANLRCRYANTGQELSKRILSTVLLIRRSAVGKDMKPPCLQKFPYYYLGQTLRSKRKRGNGRNSFLKTLPRETRTERLSVFRFPTLLLARQQGSSGAPGLSTTAGELKEGIVRSVPSHIPAFLSNHQLNTRKPIRFLNTNQYAFFSDLKEGKPSDTAKIGIFAETI